MGPGRRGRWEPGCGRRLPLDRSAPEAENLSLGRASQAIRQHLSKGQGYVQHIEGGARRLTRIGVFYDGGYFSAVNNFYNFTHPRRSRLHLGGLHDFIRDQVAATEGVPLSFCQVVDVHWFRGRLPVADLSTQQLESDRIWDDVLMSFGIVTHYLPVHSRPGQVRQEKGVDVWFALEVLELALMNRFDVVVLITGDGDYVPLVRKLNARGVRVMLLGWNVTWRPFDGDVRTIRTAEALAREVTYRIRMEEVIGEDLDGADDPLREGLFIYRPPRPAATGDTARIEALGTEQTGRVANILESFGFITPDSGGENIFFHVSELSGMRFRDLQPGDRVTYVASFNDRGPCARRVEMAGAWQEETGEDTHEGSEQLPETEAFLTFSPAQPAGRG